jgi:uncharacterized protein (DUF488 family)
MMQNLPPKKCYTIGYGDYPIDIFLYFLQKTGIDTLVDVRSSPYSNYNYSFNRDNLEKFLINGQIDYQYMGDKIGGRYSNPNLLFPDGTVNYQKVQSTEKFQEGISQVLSMISIGKRIALMCAEKEPEKCHRFALISRVLQSKGIKVIHIRPEIKLQAHEDLEKELINKIIDNHQIRISDDPVNVVDSMYEKLNKSIAFKIKDYHQPAEENDVSAYHVRTPPFNPVEEKRENIQEIPSAGGPNYSQTPTNTLTHSDSFSDRHLKKEEQQKLF